MHYIVIMWHNFVQIVMMYSVFVIFFMYKMILDVFFFVNTLKSLEIVYVHNDRNALTMATHTTLLFTDFLCKSYFLLALNV